MSNTKRFYFPEIYAELPILDLDGSTCPICEMKCLTLAGLSKHMNSKHVDACQICGADPMTANCNNAGCDV